MKTMQKIVIKLGTSTLTQGTQKLSRRFMLGLVQQILQLRSQGLQVVLVSSGAVAAGRDLLNPALGPSLPSKQVIASIGQVKLMQIWSELFSLFDLRIGQVLLTEDDFSSQREEITKNTLSSFLEHGIIPIVNENNTITNKEIDNDKLAALVAKIIGADTIILLTDQEGLFTADPRMDSDAKLIPLVEEIDDAVFALAKGSSTSFGSGGMATKVEAAQAAARSGTQTIIAPSTRPNVLLDLAKGKQIGTLFMDKEASE